MGIVFLGSRAGERRAAAEAGFRRGLGRFWRGSSGPWALLYPCLPRVYRGFWAWNPELPRPRSARALGWSQRIGAAALAASSPFEALRRDLFDDPQAPGMAFRAGILKVLTRGVRRRLGFRRRRLQVLADRRQALLAAAVGQEPVVADAHEALGQ